MANYSNGFNTELVLAELMGRIGWRQPTVSSFTTTLSPANLGSTSGRYFQDFHPICSPEIIKNIQEDNLITDDNFNTLLQNWQQADILKALNGCFNKRELIETKLLFERYGRQDYPNPNSNPDSFVGIRITAPRDFLKTMQIDTLYLYFDTNVTFNLYLFHDTIANPVWSQSVSALANEQTVISFADPLVLNYVKDHASGVYFLGYFQSDLGEAQAINEIVEKFNDLYSFGLIPVELFRKILNSDVTQINVNNVAYTIKTHGMNIRCSSFRDHTQLIVKHAYLFDELIGLQMACMVIEAIGYSGRSNKSERITKDLTQSLLNDLNGVPNPYGGAPISYGLRNQVQREINRVKADLYPKEKIRTITHNSDSEDVYGGVTQIDLFGI